SLGYSIVSPLREFGDVPVALRHGLRAPVPRAYNRHAATSQQTAAGRLAGTGQAPNGPGDWPHGGQFRWNSVARSRPPLRRHARSRSGTFSATVRTVAS